MNNQKEKRECKLCGALFIPKMDGATVKYCCKAHALRANKIEIEIWKKAGKRIDRVIADLSTLQRAIDIIKEDI